MRFAALQFENDIDNQRIHFWSRKDVFLYGEQFDQLNSHEILFIHSTDFIKLNTKQRQQILSFKGWKIRYSGDSTDATLVKLNADLKEVNNISWEMITNRFDKFVMGMEAGYTVSAIYELIGYDPHLEILLKPFETSSPFANPKETIADEEKTISEAQQQLNDYIAKK